MNTIRVEILFPNGDSLLYANMSQVPRIGDTVQIQRPEQNPIDYYEGIVSEVKWLVSLFEEYEDKDSSDCVVVCLKDKPDK